MNKSVLIPLNLLRQIIDLLYYWDISKYDRVVRDDYDDVMLALNLKLKKLDLRNTYTEIIKADNEDDRHSATMEYLRQRNLIAKGRLCEYDF